MAISSDYPTPVTVNGFSCKNCTDVDHAKKHVDPAHPKDGPYGINAKAKLANHEPAVKLGGRLAERDAAPPPSSIKAGALGAPGMRLDISA